MGLPFASGIPAIAQTTAAITPINYGAAVGILQAGDGNFYAPSQPIPTACTADTTKLCSFIYKNGALFLASDGNLYGTTLIGGNTTSDNCKPLGCGTLYQVTPAGVLTDLHDFTGGAADPKNPTLPPTIGGAGPTTPLVQADGGVFYGTQLGGTGTPVVYKAELTPSVPSPIEITFDPAPAIPGEPTTLTWKVLNAFSLTAQQCGATIVGAPVGAGTWTGSQTGTLANGIYSGTAQITPTANGLYNYSLTCGGKETGSASLTVNKDGALKIVTKTQSMPQGTVNNQYDALVTAAGGFTPYQWSITQGQLPPGLTAEQLNDADFTISGIPTQFGTYSMIFDVVDSSKPQEHDSQSIAIVIKSGLTLIQNLPNPVLNASYSSSLAPDTSGGIDPYTWQLTAGKLPTGLQLNTATGLISGTSTEAGTFSFTITVTDSENTPDHIQVGFTLKVAGPLQVSQASLLPASVGEFYSVGLQASGGTPPYKWAFGPNGGGDVPPNMALAMDGTFEGTPTQYSTAANGLNQFNVVVTDSSVPPQQAPGSYSIAVKKSLKIQTTSLPNGTIGVVASVPLMATGGIPPYTWTAVVLPNPNPGVQVNGSSLDYNPTIAGNYVVTLTVQDSERIPDSEPSVPSLSLIIVPLQLPTTTTLTASNTTAGTGQSILFTAKVTPAQGTIAPTGQVTFFNGSTILGAAPLGANGIATFQTSFASVGVDSITAAYGGSGTYSPSTSVPLTETVVAPTVNASISPSSITIQSGGTGQLVITITPVGNYTGTITFSCGALPPLVSCSFNPPSLTIPANSGPLTSTLTVSTGAVQTAAAMQSRPTIGLDYSHIFSAATLWLPGSLAFLLIMLRRNRRLVFANRGNPWLVVILWMLCAIGLAGCGAAAANKAAPGTYKIPVTLTVQGQGPQNISATIIVQ